MNGGTSDVYINNILKNIKRKRERNYIVKLCEKILSIGRAYFCELCA